MVVLHRTGSQHEDNTALCGNASEGSTSTAGTDCWRTPITLGSYQGHGYVVNMAICREGSRGIDWHDTGARAAL